MKYLLAEAIDTAAEPISRQGRNNKKLNKVYRPVPLKYVNKNITHSDA